MPALIEARDLTKKIRRARCTEPRQLLRGGRPHRRAHRPERRRQDGPPLRAILGLTTYEGQLSVLGREPFSRPRAQLMHDASFIADVAVLPAWLRVDHAIDFVAGVHPRFRRDRGGGAAREKPKSPAKRRPARIVQGP